MEILNHSSYIRRKDMDSVLNCLVTDKLDPGEYSDKFIKTAKERLLFDYGTSTRNPIIALQLAMECLALVPGDKIAMSALSPAWAFKAVATKAVLPLWLDVDIYNASVNAASIEKIRSEGAKAIYLAEPWGIMPDPLLFADLGLPVIEDNSFSLGTRSGDIMAGSIGTFCLAALEPGCAITAGGGALLYASAKRDALALRNAAESLLPEERMSDMNSALALTQLRDLDKFLAKRKELTELYIQSAARGHKKLLASGNEEDSCYFGCVVVFDSGTKEAMAYAKKKGVNSSMAFEDSCAARGFVAEGLCPNAASLVNRAVSFPLNQRIGNAAAQKIARVLASLP